MAVQLKLFYYFSTYQKTYTGIAFTVDVNSRRVKEKEIEKLMNCKNTINMSQAEDNIKI